MIVTRRRARVPSAFGGALLVQAIYGLGNTLSAQQPAAASGVAVTGAISVTNKGISTVPSFTLGKPAAIFDVSIARSGLSFDPQFRFGLDGKPWSFLFWGRYRLVESEKFRISIGAHPALAFRTLPVTVNGMARDVIVARRYLAGEVAPTYALTRSVGIGAYWLYSYGVERDVAKHTNFLAARVSLANIGLPEELSLRFDPQLYYLRTDDRDGIYAYSGATLSRGDLPLSISAIVNKPIRSDVVGGGDFLWSVSARYSIR